MGRSWLAAVVAVAVVAAGLAIEAEDPYSVLGVPKDATLVQIRIRFRKSALHHHPERNKGPTAASDFIRVAAAFRLLSDPAARARYDASGAGWTPTASHPTQFAESFDATQFYADFDRELNLHFKVVKDQPNKKMYKIDHGATDAELDAHMSSHLEAVASMRKELHPDAKTLPGTIDIKALFVDFADPRMVRHDPSQL